MHSEYGLGRQFLAYKCIAHEKGLYVEERELNILYSG